MRHRAESMTLSSFRTNATGRQQYLKDRSMGLTEGHRQAPAMIFYDRPADRQAHAHTMGFGRKERLEDAVDVCRIDPYSAVFHRDQQMIRFMYCSLYSQNPRTIHHSTHRVNGVPDQVHDYLLQLDSIDRNLWEGVVRVSQREHALAFATIPAKGWLIS
jgi:hypothetical protein